MKPGITLAEVDARCRWRAWLTPSVILPACASLPFLLGGIVSGTPFWLSCAALSGLAAAARGIYRLTAGRASLQAQALAELQAEATEEHFTYLRELRGRLRGDRDPRTGECVKQLQDIYRRWLELHQQTTSREQAAAWDSAQLGIQELYEQSLHALERSWTLWKSTEKLHNADFRNQTLAARDQIVKEVQQTIQHLQEALDQWQVARPASLHEPDPVRQLEQLQSQLDRGLEVARNVDARMAELEGELRRHVDPLDHESPG